MTHLLNTGRFVSALRVIWQRFPKVAVAVLVIGLLASVSCEVGFFSAHALAQGTGTAQGTAAPSTTPADAATAADSAYNSALNTWAGADAKATSTAKTAAGAKIAADNAHAAYAALTKNFTSGAEFDSPDVVSARANVDAADKVARDTAYEATEARINADSALNNLGVAAGAKIDADAKGNAANAGAGNPNGGPGAANGAPPAGAPATAPGKWLAIPSRHGHDTTIYITPQGIPFGVTVNSDGSQTYITDHGNFRLTVGTDGKASWASLGSGFGAATNPLDHTTVSANGDGSTSYYTPKGIYHVKLNPDGSTTYTTGTGTYIGQVVVGASGAQIATPPVHSVINDLSPVGEPNIPETPPPPEKPAPPTENNGNQSGTNTTPGASSTEPTTNVAVSAPGTGAQVSEPGVQTTQPKTTSGGVTTPGENQPGQTTTGGTPGASQTVPEAQVSIAKQDTNDFGAGSHHEVGTDSTGRILKWRDVDPKGNVREDGIDQYGTTPSGTSVKTEETRDYFSDRGTLQSRTISDWDLTGKQTSFRLTDYSFRGYKISDHITKYETEWHVESTWNPRTYGWDSTTIPYTPAAAPAAPPTQTGSAAGTQLNWNLRLDYKIGCLFPLDYHAGDRISGSCWKADYAEAFKTVPGLYEYSFPIQTYPLQDGTPNWSGMEFGVKGYGYSPMGSDGRICLHIPKDWKGPLQIQFRQPDYLTGNTPFTTNFEVGDPLASPTLPSNLFSKQLQENIDYESADHLVDLWNEAFSLEEERDELLDNGEHYPGEIYDVEEDLDDVYDELDYATDYLPTSVIVSMARRMAQHNRDLNAELRTENLTPEQETRLQGYDRWATFLEKEADYFTEEATYYSHYPVIPLWASPVQSQDKLIAIRGPFFGDPYNTGIYIDGTPIRPLAMTPKLCYFMPTPGLTAGEHTYSIDSPGMPVTTLPFFYLWMTMWGDDLDLHKGQKTNYHLKFDVSLNATNNKLWSSLWSSSFFPSDLMNSTVLQGSSMPGPSRRGFITVTITNDPTDAVTMKDVFKTYEASQLEPQGSIQLDGGLTAKRDGTFKITGVVSAFPQPLLGLGLWPGTTTPSTSTPTSEPLLPNYGWSLPPTTSTPSNLNCPGLSTGSTAPEATGTSAASTPSNINLPISHCMGSAAFDDYTQATGGQPTVEIGNPPTQAEADAARTRVRDAAKKAADAETKYNQTRDKWANLWVKGLYNIPEEDRKKYQAIADESLHADVAWDNAMDELIKNSSVENGKKLEDASIRRATANDAYEKARKEALDKFSPKDRAAYDAADQDQINAAIDRSIANEELRDARAALEELHLPMSTWLKYAF
jgi:hypothetical protein